MCSPSAHSEVSVSRTRVKPGHQNRVILADGLFPCHSWIGLVWASPQGASSGSPGHCPFCGNSVKPMASGPLWAREVSLEGGDRGPCALIIPAHTFFDGSGYKNHKKDRFLHPDHGKELGVVLGSDSCKLGATRGLVQDTVL